MPGIGNFTIEQFKERINRFDRAYVKDWDSWLSTSTDNQAVRFGFILRRWQACRPNRMRRTKADNLHQPPYLEDLMGMANLHLPTLGRFDIRQTESFSQQNTHALSELWHIFQHLPYHGWARNGMAGVAGISKAVLLLTRGSVGPAFDSRVRENLQVPDIKTSTEWINALMMVNQDIQQFEANNGTSIIEAAPEPFRHLKPGRIYDMALGPGN